MIAICEVYVGMLPALVCSLARCGPDWQDVELLMSKAIALLVSHEPNAKSLSKGIFCSLLTEMIVL